MALDAGADFIGFVLTESPRQLSPEHAATIRAALPKEAPMVGVFADERPEVVAPIVRGLNLHAVQVSGWLDLETTIDCEIWHVLRSAHLPDPETLSMVPLRTYVLDAHDGRQPGGTGKRSDWTWGKRCVDLGRRLIVAGGLNGSNVEPLIQDVRPFGVDASSGLESRLGKKSPEKVRAFVEQIRAADRVRPKRS